MNKPFDEWFEFPRMTVLKDTREAFTVPDGMVQYIIYENEHHNKKFPRPSFCVNGDGIRAIVYEVAIEDLLRTVYNIGVTEDRLELSLENTARIFVKAMYKE